MIPSHPDLRVTIHEPSESGYPILATVGYTGRGLRVSFKFKFKYSNLRVALTGRLTSLEGLNTVAFQVSTGTSLDDSESETFDVTDSKFEIDRVMPRRIKFKLQ